MPFYGNGPLLFSDDFTYSDGSLATVGTAKWAAGYWTGQPSLRVVSNQAAGPSANGTWSDIYSKTTYDVGSTGLEFIWYNVTIADIGSVWTYMHLCGTHAASPSGYWLRWRADGGNTYQFGKLVAGSFTTLLNITTTVPVDGDDLCVQILPDGTVSVFMNRTGSWEQIGSSITDTSYTSGEVGMETYLADDRWDSIEVREVPSAGGTVAPTIVWGSIVASVDAAAPYTVTGSLPAHVADDILIACASKNNGSDLTCGTSGWAEILPDENNANLSTGWFWKRATSSSETAPVITASTAGSSSAGIYVTCARIRGCVATGTPFEDATLDGTPTNSTTPAGSTITTTDIKRLAVAIALIDDNNTISSGYPPSTWSTGVNTGSDTGGDGKCLAIHKAIDAAGNVTGVNIGVQAASDYWKTLTLAFIPVIVLTSRLKHWNGSSWVSVPIKHGSGWPEVVLEPA
jgi:hypothetical protein